MRAIDAYKDLLIELDKYESPSLTIKDFLYFFNAEINEFVDAKHAEGPDILQGPHDDIKVLLSDPTPLSFGSETFSPLPEAYRNVLNLEIVLKFTKDKGKYKKDAEITIYPRKLRSNRKGYVNNNSYQKASIKRAWYSITGSNIHIHKDSDLSIVSGKMEYLKTPNVVLLATDYKDLSDEDKNKEENNSTLQFPVNTVNKIIRLCRTSILENQESGRYQSSLNENFLVTK